jgi:molybdopterin synthase sulfur carrier subunit
MRGHPKHLGKYWKMNISLKLIATYRKFLPEGTPGNTIKLEITPGTKVEVLVSTFGIPVDDTSVIVVNGQTPVDGQELEDGDVVSVFPALAGG